MNEQIKTCIIIILCAYIIGCKAFVVHPFSLAIKMVLSVLMLVLMVIYPAKEKERYLFSAVLGLLLSI